MGDVVEPRCRGASGPPLRPEGAAGALLERESRVRARVRVINTVRSIAMDRLTLRFWAIIIVACLVFAAIPWGDVHPTALVGYPDESLAQNNDVQVHHP
jgi:hypothetical protein